MKRTTKKYKSQDGKIKRHNRNETPKYQVGGSKKSKLRNIKKEDDFI